MEWMSFFGNRAFLFLENIFIIQIVKTKYISLNESSGVCKDPLGGYVISTVFDTG